MRLWFVCCMMLASLNAVHGQSEGQESEIKTKEEFLAKYSPFAEAISEDCANFTLRAKVHHINNNNGKTLADGIIQIYRRGDSVRLDYLPIEENADNPAKFRIVSPDRSFQVERGGENKDYYLTELSGEELSNNYLLFEEDLRVKRPIVSPWTGFLEKTVESWVSNPDVKLIRAEINEETPRRLIVSFERQFPDANQPVKFEFLMDQGWALSRYMLGFEEKNNISQQLLYEEESATPAVPLSLVKKQENKKYSKDPFFVEQYQIEEFLFEKPSWNVFRLSAFGLDDNVGIRSWSMLWWLLIITVVLFCGAGATMHWRNK